MGSKCSPNMDEIYTVGYKIIVPLQLERFEKAMIMYFRLQSVEPSIYRITAKITQ